MPGNSKQPQSISRRAALQSPMPTLMASTASGKEGSTPTLWPVRTKQQHLDRAAGPKRVLSLDGGGIRGVLTLEYLGAIEAMLKKRSGREDFVLCDYFDLIGGTSTGSIIAAGLACGMSVDSLKQLYGQIGQAVFKTGFFRKGFLVPKFPSVPLQEALEKQLGADTSLDSDRVRTGLMIMTKRLDTGSPWPLHNHPDATYAKQDGRLLLAHVVRASTAAPTYFEPEEISISTRSGSSMKAAFVDGGVSPFNDPALQLLMLTTLEGHGFRWPTGKDNLLLVSIGTGAYSERFSAEKLMGMPPVEQGVRALQSLMDDCGRLNRTMLGWLTNCLTPSVVDHAVGDMALDSKNGPQLATYVRYNVLLEDQWLKSKLGISRSTDMLGKLAQMDDAGNIAELSDLGRLASSKQVQHEHFSSVFDG